MERKAGAKGRSERQERKAGAKGRGKTSYKRQLQKAAAKGILANPQYDLVLFVKLRKDVLGQPLFFDQSSEPGQKVELKVRNLLLRDT